jgi:hypothetical protein
MMMIQMTTTVMQAPNHNNSNPKRRQLTLAEMTKRFHPSCQICNRYNLLLPKRQTLVAAIRRRSNQQGNNQWVVFAMAKG